MSENNTKRMKRELRVDLTAEERTTRSHALANAIDERQRLDRERKEKAKMYGDLMKEKTKRIEQLAEDVRTGSEKRHVECEELHDFRLGKVITTRLDTGAVIDERAMTPKERQTDLEVLGGSKGKGKGKGSKPN